MKSKIDFFQSNYLLRYRIFKNFILFLIIISFIGLLLSCSPFNLINNNNTQNKEYKIFALNYNNNELYLISIYGNKNEVKKIGGEFDGEIFGPKLSPDNKKILLGFKPTISRNTDLLYVMNIDGTERINLTDGLIGYSYGPSFSPDGKKIIFNGWQNSNTSDSLNPSLYIVNIDGSHRIDLLKDSAIKGDIEGSPVFSPDGKKILFIFRYLYSKKYSLCIFDLEKNILINLVKDVGYSIGNRRFLPDSKQVLFEYAPLNDYNSSSYKLSIINSDGTGKINLAENINIESYSSVISPDGKKVLFVGYENNYNLDSKSPSLFSININGSDITNILKTIKLNGKIGRHFPVFSPDGKKILINIEQTNSESLYIFDLNTRVLNLLAYTETLDYYTFSSDSIKVLFRGSFEGEEFIYYVGTDNLTGKKLYNKVSKKIYIINTDGTKLISLDDIVGKPLRSAEWFLSENNDYY